MSTNAPIEQVHTSTPSAPSATDALTAAGVASTHGTSKISKASSKPQHFSTMADIKKFNPKLYNMMMTSIAQNICTEMQHNQDRLKEAWRKFRENSG